MVVHAHIVFAAPVARIRRRLESLPDAAAELRRPAEQ